MIRAFTVFSVLLIKHTHLKPEEIINTIQKEKVQTKDLGRDAKGLNSLNNDIFIGPYSL